MNLASRVLGQSTRRLGDGMRKLHGHPVPLAETFVDPARFTGACYRAANWQPLGRTKGFARNPGVPVTWTAHGQPKEVFVYPLVHDAREHRVDRRSTPRRFPPLRNSSRPDCRLVKPPNSSGQAGQRLTESQRRCVEGGIEVFRALREILRTNLAMTPSSVRATARGHPANSSQFSGQLPGESERCSCARRMISLESQCGKSARWVR